MNFLDSFAEKHPKAAEWIRKGGLFLIFSWVVTALKAVMLMFLPSLFHGNVTFKSHGPLAPQLGLHFLATVVVFLVMNLFTCVWNPVTVALISNEAVRNTVSSIVTTVVTGGVAMVIIFAVDNKIFAPGFGKR